MALKKEAVSTKKIKIMPLGDSMTHGFRIEGGYRKTLETKLKAAGLDEYVEFVGTQKNGAVYDGKHEGHPGWAIEPISAFDDIEKNGRNGLTTEIDTWMMDASPDIVLLQIGTNDILAQYKLDETSIRLRVFVDKIISKLPKNGKVYIAKIPNMDVTSMYNKTGIQYQEVFDSQVIYFNKAVERIAKEKGFTVVDINSVIDMKTDLLDGIHPNEKGYEKMGEKWYSSIIEDIQSRINQD